MDYATPTRVKDKNPLFHCSCLDIRHPVPGSPLPTLETNKYKNEWSKRLNNCFSFIFLFLILLIWYGDYGSICQIATLASQIKCIYIYIYIYKSILLEMQFHFMSLYLTADGRPRLGSLGMSPRRKNYLTTWRIQYNNTNHILKFYLKT